jgi:hypothetical protein
MAFMVLMKEILEEAKKKGYNLELAAERSV